MKRFPVYRQLEANDCGPTCLQIICAYYKKRIDLRELRKLCGTTRVGTTILDIMNGAKKLGLQTFTIKTKREELHGMPLPSILYWNQEHFVVLYEIVRLKDKTFYKIVDPSFGKVKLNENDFNKSYFGNLDYGISLVLETTSEFHNIKEKKSNFIAQIGSFAQYVKPIVLNRRLQFIFSILLACLAMVANWLVPIVFQKIIDNGIGNKDIGLIKILALSQLCLFLGYILANNFSSIFLTKIGFKLGISFLTRYINKLIKLSINFFDTKSNSDLIQLTDDQENIKSFFTHDCINFLFAITNLLVFSGILIYYELRIFLFFALTSILSFLWTYSFLKRRRELNYMRFSMSSESRNNIYELVNGMKEIKINNAQKQKVNQIQQNQEKLNEYNLKTIYLNFKNSFGVSLFSRINDVAIILFCSHLIIQNTMTIGIMMSISYLLGQLNTPFSQIINFIQSSQEVGLSITRFQDIQAMEEENHSSTQIIPNPLVAGFHLEKLSFKYEGSYNPYVLNNITLDIPKGMTTAIVGTSGSGKTTLLKLLLGFYYPQKGDIFIDGVKMTNLNSDEWRKKCGVVMQDGYLFSGTIRDNISFGDKENNIQKLEKSSQIACIDDFIKKLPMGYDTKIGNTGIELSGGQRQRLLIARAVYKNPELIFFDEATSFLDSYYESKIIQNLKQFYLGKTVVIIAHRLSTVKDADKIIVLDDGSIAEEGNHIELATMRGKYYNLVQNQLELDR
nr:peptidase domain-containing ABC transporter [uncultured Draconibacterium sp.]